MELHPDRNYGNVEETTKQFAAVQSAYEILSDPQERAWYDTHREAILRDEGTISGDHYEHNIRVTTADDILRMFTQFHGKIDFSDSETGFYGSLRERFGALAREEELACEWEGVTPTSYPSFGYAGDSYEDVVKPFYAMWNGFATKKSFSWEDIYHYSEAPDRRVRRLMEKENKRLREEGIKKFNDAVRSLVNFVKKRDPRFKPNIQNEAERQKMLRDAASAQAARSRAANNARQALAQRVPDWAKSSDIGEDSMSSEEEDPVKDQFECIVCKKSFKSEKQYEGHEKSKKHMKAVQHLRRLMQQEDKDLDLDKGDQQPTAQQAAILKDESGSFSTASESEAADGISTFLQERTDDDATDKPTQLKNTYISETKNEILIDESPKTISNGSIFSSEDDEYASRKEVEDRILGGDEDGLCVSQDDINDISEKLASGSLRGEIDLDTRPKVGKAKAKRAKRAAQNSSTVTGSGQDFKCTACQARFPSKTRLFNHIKNLGHAQPVLKPTKGGKAKR